MAAAELNSVHRYAAGGLLALALSQAQIQQHSFTGFGFPPVISPEDGHSTSAALSRDDVVPWSSEQSGLLRHIFRYLGIDEKAWAGLEFTSVSPDAKHHIEAVSDPISRSYLHRVSGARQFGNEPTYHEGDGLVMLRVSSEFLKILAEDDSESRKIRNAEVALAKGVDAMVQSIKDKQGITDANEPRVDAENSERGDTNNEVKSLVLTEAKHLSRERKVTVVYTLLAACVADTSEEKSGNSKLRAGYDARQRVALRLLALWLDLDWSKVAAMELMVAYMAMAAEKERQQQHVDDEEVAQSRWSQWKRGGLIGAAALTGGTLLAITGGLAAPALAAGMTAIGTAVPVLGASGLTAAAAVAGSAMGSVAVAASFGAAGAGLTGIKMARRTADIDEFQFEALGGNHQQGVVDDSVGMNHVFLLKQLVSLQRLAVEIVVSGIAFHPDDFLRPWEAPDGDMERYALRWETENVMAVSTAIQDWLTSTAAREMIKRGAMYTVLGGLVTALATPLTVLGVTGLIDSKWAIAVDRSDKAGKLLAMILLKGGQGARPVTLMGYSLGGRVIFACLEELAKHEDTGSIVERVVLLGAPLTMDRARWETVRKVVAGRFVNGFSTNDWVLGVAYRATFLSQGLAGLQVVDVPGIENVDLTELVNGHSSYMTSMGEILDGINIDSFYAIHSSKLHLSNSHKPASTSAGPAKVD